MIAPGHKSVRCIGGPIDVFVAVVAAGNVRLSFCWRQRGRRPVWLLYAETDATGDGRGPIFEYEGFRYSRAEADAWGACA